MGGVVKGVLLTLGEKSLGVVFNEDEFKEEDEGDLFSEVSSTPAVSTAQRGARNDRQVWCLFSIQW